MPGFIKNYEKVKAKGYEVIACVTVNDPFVSGAWGKSAQASNKVRILADPSAEFTKVIFKKDHSKVNHYVDHFNILNLRPSIWIKIFLLLVEFVQNVIRF